jgi:FKBP-type peptidyl-prolyl cis-trans isomerase FklB
LPTCPHQCENHRHAKTIPHSGQYADRWHSFVGKQCGPADSGIDLQTGLDGQNHHDHHSQTAYRNGGQKHSSLTLTTQKDKLSYAIGMNVGQSMKKDSLDIDPNIVAQGLKDTFSGGKLLMTNEEATTVMTNFRIEMTKKKEAEAQHIGETNKQAGQQFLAANKAKGGVVTLPSGLQYKILKEGSGPKPTASDTVVCNYRGTLLDGTEFDSSYKGGQPATFPVGQVIKGWTEALQLMPVGSRWEVYVPAELAYGERSPGAGIGPNSTLIFEIDLLSIQDKKP